MRAVVHVVLRSVVPIVVNSQNLRSSYAAVESVPYFVSCLTINRPELLETRNQLHATRDRVESYRMKLKDNPLDSPASPLQISVSAAS